MSKTQRQGIKALDLAISNEHLGNDAECETAARTAGRCARLAGFDLEQVWRAVPDMGAHSMTWNYVVDGWYEAA